MMHPADFVRTMIAEGRTKEVVEVIDGFRRRLRQSKTPEHATVYNFANNFLVSVAGQLLLLGPGQDLHEDRLLTVWAELAYFGIDRSDTEDNPGEGTAKEQPSQS